MPTSSTITRTIFIARSKVGAAWKRRSKVGASLEEEGNLEEVIMLP